MHFPAISRLKFQRFSLQCQPRGHPTESLNQAFSKETESLGKYRCRQKCFDKQLPPVFLGSRHTKGTKKRVPKGCCQKPKHFHLWSVYIQTSKAAVPVPHNTKVDNLLLKSLTGQILWPTNVFYGQKFYSLKLISLICHNFFYANYDVPSDLADIVNKWYHLHLLVNQEQNFPFPSIVSFFLVQLTCLHLICASHKVGALI